MSKIKICGMQRREDIIAANQALPDFVGFIFADFDRHCITEEQAREFKSLLSPDIKSVGAFVNAPIDDVIRLLNDGIIDFAQLHGNEDESYVRTVMDKTHKPVINATGVKVPEDINKVISSCSDFILLDAPGGCTGNTFDWNLIKDIRRPYFLAGGINTANIQDAINRFHPYSIDLSTGAETKGQKDPAKMMELVKLAREAS
ncbi:phosphoribosylanthranilate isomerase [Sporolactobacillus pectinivorans]|uniref:phosphoribosylanthranilate isomerase n=1 Tax=Sporolactobacillus pectinivorans TaxID=1591408 RepID=UPI000C2692B2|nr:phosphoribosylanthranilate isomerase [Sporolactobacillus pectinivorans]